MTKRFCSRCGNDSLHRVAVTVNSDGTLQMHINWRRLQSKRGLKYSLPAPKGNVCVALHQSFLPYCWTVLRAYTSELPSWLSHFSRVIKINVHCKEKRLTPFFSLERPEISLILVARGCGSEFDSIHLKSKFMILFHLTHICLVIASTIWIELPLDVLFYVMLNSQVGNTLWDHNYSRISECHKIG